MSIDELPLLDRAITPQAMMGRLSGAMRRQIARESEDAIRDGIVGNVREQARAHIAHVALQNVGALTDLEERLLRVAPLGAARYQYIVDAYMFGAADVIERW